MQSPKTQVTLYLHNRVDEAFQVDLETLPNLFIAALEREDYKPSGRLSYEFEYRWWLTGSEKTGGLAATWDEADFDALFEPFITRVNEDSEYHDRVWARMDPS